MSEALAELEIFDERQMDEPDIPEPTSARNFMATFSAVMVKESLRRMRGRRAFAMLTIYVALLALVVFAVQGMVHDSMRWQMGFDGMEPSGDLVAGWAAAAIGQAIFAVILVVQTLLTLMLAPALTSGAISLEREKQTLEMLITTPASTLGLVVGKLFSSLAYVFLLTLASVPLMSIVFAFGGIAPDDVIRAYILLFAMAFGIGSIGLFISALLKRTQVATAVSYVIVFALAIGTLVLYVYLAAAPRFAGDGFQEPLPPPEAVLWLNPLVANMDLMCTAIPDPSGGSCAITFAITGDWQRVNAPRDVLWPKVAISYVLLGIGLTLATTQLIAPSRRAKRHGPPLADPSP
jgi:ABC-2 type transport system permease protein